MPDKPSNKRPLPKDAAAPTLFRFSVVDGKRDIAPRLIEVPWKSFVRSMANVAVRDEKDGPAWLPATFTRNGRTDNGVESITACVLDIDHDNIKGKYIEKTLNGFAFIAHTTYSSKPEAKRWRIAIPLAQSVAPGTAPALFEHFNQMFNGLLDPACKNASRIHYLPSCPPHALAAHEFMERGGKPFDASTLPNAGDISVKSTPITPAAEVPAEFYNALKTDTKLRLVWEGADVAGLKDTSRSGRDMQLIAMLTYRGYTDPEIAAILLAFVHGKAAEAGQKYLEHTIAKARKPIPEPAPDRFRAYPLGDYIKRPPQEWRIKKLLPAHGLAMVYAPDKSGKSYVVFEACARIALGESFFGYETKQAGVVYIAAEGAHGLVDRSKAWIKAHGKIPPMAIIPAAVDFYTGEDVQLVIDAVLDVEPALGRAVRVAVIDTAAKSMPGGDENSVKDMARFFANCEALARAIDGVVIIIHHAGKDPTRGARGSSSIPAAMDAEWELVRVRNAPTGMLTGTLKLTRLRDGEDGFIIGGYALERVDLGLDVDGNPVHSAIVRHVAPTTVAPAARRVTANAQVANDALLKALEKHGKPCAGATRSVSEQEWREQFYEMQPLDESTSKEELKRQTRARLQRFDRARDLLREVGAIDGADSRVWLTIDAR